MAKCQVQIDEAFALRLATLADKTDVIVPKVLEAGGEVVLAKVKSNLESALSGDSTGELARSLGL
jgi:ubiquinone biosynthesis protein UbiJ